LVELQLSLVRSAGGRIKNVHYCQDYIIAYWFERFHDLRLVRTLEKSSRPQVVHRGVGKLGIPLFEYLLQVPANRIGYSQLSVAQLKITQEVITLSVFAPFAVVYMKEPLKLDYLWAGLCLLGAVYFMFRS
jgi:uncharacterized protein (DUF486 family)